MFYNNIESIIRVIVVGVCAYLALVILLRASGKRTLSKMSAFDLVVTVALGSTLATVLLSKDVALLEGVTAFALLILMQFIIAWLSVRSESVRRLVKSEPTLLFHQGHFLESVMKAERITKDEIHAAVRAQGIPVMDKVGAVVLETDGSFTILPSTDESATALKYVQNHQHTD